MVKKLIIIAISILILPIVIITANAIPNDDMIRYLSNSESSLNDDYESSRFTQKDDLSVNTIKGVNLRLIDDVTLEEKNVLNYDKEIVTKGNSTLYFNSYLNIFKVSNNTTGYVWSTGQDVIYKTNASAAMAKTLASTITMEYNSYNNLEEHYNTKVSSIELNSATNGDIYKLKPNPDVDVKDSNITNGKKLTIFYKKVGIRLNLYVSLDEAGNLNIQVPNSEIEEHIADKTDIISGLRFAPAIGSNVDGTVPGYFVIPDGSGSLIRYGQVTASARYEIPYYGQDFGLNPSLENDSQYLSLPVFGIVNGVKQDACLAVIEEGDTSCNLYINVKGSITSNYNALSPRFKLRNQYLLYGINQSIEEERINQDYKVHYEFLSGESSTYVGLANQYSDYLVKNDLIIKSSDGSYKLRIDALLSEPVKALIGTKNVQMTKLDDLEKMINELEENNIHNLTLLMLGWNSTGYSSTPPYKIKYNNKVGSKKDFIKFTEEQFNKNNKVYYYNDYVQAGEGGEFSERTDVARSIQRLRLSYTWDANVYDEYHYLYPSRSRELINDDFKAYKKLGINSLALDSIGTRLYTTYYKNVISHTSDSAKIYEELLNDVNNQNMDIALYKPFAYLFKNLNTYLDMPLYSNQYSYYTDTVPFVPYVLRGTVDAFSAYHNFFANSEEQALRALDYGIYPSYILTSGESRKLKYTDSYYLFTTEYNHWKTDIINRYDTLKDGYTTMSNQKVVDREVLEPGVIKITYQNNQSIIINYKSNSYMVEGGSGEWKTLS